MGSFGYVSAEDGRRGRRKAGRRVKSERRGRDGGGRDAIGRREYVDGRASLGAGACWCVIGIVGRRKQGLGRWLWRYIKSRMCEDRSRRIGE